MNIRTIKTEMLNYCDFYGGDISDTKAIREAKTKQELEKILDNHDSFLDDMVSDAHSHLDNFRHKLGLM